MNVREKRTHKYLEELGYIVHTVSRPTRFGISQDLFNLFDHIAVAKFDVATMLDCYTNRGDCIFVQTKSRKQYGKWFEKYKDFPHPNQYVFVWDKQSNGRYQLIVQNINLELNKRKK